MSDKKRIQSGTPTGGQFAAHQQEESPITIDSSVLDTSEPRLAGPDDWVSVLDPGNEMNPPIWEGIASDAPSELVPGMYAAVDENGDPVSVDAT
ncbi:MAG: hypothetical protein WKF57_06150 [Nakamurella sp.]